MNVGILYDATTISKKGSEVEHSLLNSVSKISEELELMGHFCKLFNASEELGELFNLHESISVIINYIPWTRTNKQILYPSLLNYLKIPYIGNSNESLVICANKVLTKLLAKENEIPIPRYKIFSDKFTYMDLNSYFKDLFVLKANKTSGSLGVSLIHSEEEYILESNRLQELWGNDIYIEEYIDGIDLTVPIICKDGKPKALGTVTYLDKNLQNIPFFTHENKYHKKITCVNYFDPIITPRALKYAEIIHSLCCCTSLSRVDFRASPSGELYLLEINGTPELNSTGAFTTAGSGRSLSDILDLCINEALNH